MRKLSKVLALVLTFAMALTLMAGAAFTDQAEIKFDEAVDTVSALGIIKGYPDGSFDPDKTVTRAEMAKMIYVLRMGNDNADSFKGMNIGFTDIAGSWAEGYINFCASLDIINGYTDGTFRPNDPVTGLEAAKMVLAAAGYSANKAGFTGANWAINVSRVAIEAGLFEDYDIAYSAACPREYAALLLYNAVFVNAVKWSNDSESFVGYNPEATVGEKYLSLDSFTGVLTATGKYAISGSAKADTAKVGGKELSWTNNESANIGCEVKVLYKAAKGGGIGKVYGMYATSGNVIENAAVSAVSVNGSKIKVNGNEYAIDASAIVYSDFGYTKADLGKKLGFDVTLISNDGDSSDIDVIIFNDCALDQISSISKTSFRAKNAGTFKFADKPATYEGMAAGDFVLYSKDRVNGVDVFEKVDVEKGTISATKGATYKIGSTYYEAADAAFAFGAISIARGDKIDYILVNDLICYAAAQTAAGADAVDASQVLFLKKIGAYDEFDEYARANVLFADGTTKSVNVNKIEGAAFNSAAANKLYTFEEKDGFYALKALDAARTDLGVDKVKSGAVYEKAAIDGEDVSDDAVFFMVKYTAAGAVDSVSVVSGKELKTYAGKIGDKKAGIVLFNKYSGFYAADLGIFYGDNGQAFAPEAAKGTTTFGVVVSDAEIIRDEDDKDWVVATLWNGKENAEYKFAYKSGSMTDATLYTDLLVEFSAKEDGTAELVNSWEIKAGNVAAIDAYSAATKRITFAGDTNRYTLDKDTVIVYIDPSADAADRGLDNGVIEVAYQNAKGNFVPNVLFEADSKNVITVMYVAVDGDILGLGDNIDEF